MSVKLTWTQLNKHDNEASDAPSFHLSRACRIAFLGAPKVGKTSIIRQFLDQKFLDKYKPTVDNIVRRDYKGEDGQPMSLELIDAGGNTEFPAMLNLYIDTSDAFVIVYTRTDRNSMNEAVRLRDLVLEKRGDAVPIVFVSNKIDIDDEAIYDFEISENMSDEIHVSAKENVRIADIFDQLVKKQPSAAIEEATAEHRRHTMPSKLHKPRFSFLRPKSHSIANPNKSHSTKEGDRCHQQ